MDEHAELSLAPGTGGQFASVWTYGKILHEPELGRREEAGLQSSAS